MPTRTGLRRRLRRLEARSASARVPVMLIARDHSGTEVGRTTWFVERAFAERGPVRFTLHLGERAPHRRP